IYGKFRAKAFPGRAAILIKLLGLDESHISAVYEIRGSIKVGHYVPGTRIPILPEATMF
ncbi:MAG TPA: methyltransferase, partial [Dehalococcoidia bacterium]|nr:methyltransferase [Dehalococcoidia bacterium]